MGTFLEKIRMLQGKADFNPTHNKFSLELFIKEYSNQNNKDADDARVFYVASFISIYINLIRNEVKNIDLSRISTDEIIPALIASANKDIIIIRDRVKESLSKKTSINFSSLSGFRVELPLLKNATNTDSIAQTLSTTMRNVLPYALEHCSKKNIKSDFTQICFAATAIINLSISQDILSDIWKSAIWEYASVTSDKNTITFLTNNKFYHEPFILANKRRSDNYVEQIFHLNDLSKQRPLAVPFKLPVLKNGSKPTFKDCDTDTAIRYYALLFSADEYLEQIINEKLPLYDNITLNDLIKSLFLLCNTIEKKYYSIEDSNANSMGSLKKFAPKFSSGDLLRILNSIVHNDKKSKTILDIFTYPMESYREDITIKLFAKHKNHYYPLFASKAPNIPYMMESWLTKSGIDMARRGELFEKFFAEKMKELLENEPKGTHVLSRSMVHLSKDKEEIDFCFMLGETLYVCELKCNKPPLDEHSRFFFIKEMQTAATQILRKVEFIEKNKQDFIKKFNLHTILNIKPIIITNTREGVGLTFSDVPVTDYKTIDTYLSMGCRRITATCGMRSEVARGEEPFYSTEQEKLQNFFPHLKNPPTLIHRNDIVKEFTQTLFSPLGKTEFKYSFYDIDADFVDPLIKAVSDATGIV